MSIEYEIHDLDVCQKSLTTTLSSFEQLWPIYKQFGFDRATALLDFRMSGIIEALYELLEDDWVDGDEWKQGLDP